MPTYRAVVFNEYQDYGFTNRFYIQAADLDAARLAIKGFAEQSQTWRSRAHKVLAYRATDVNVLRDDTFRELNPGFMPGAIPIDPTQAGAGIKLKYSMVPSDGLNSPWGFVAMPFIPANFLDDNEITAAGATQISNFGASFLAINPLLVRVVTAPPAPPAYVPRGPLLQLSGYWLAAMRVGRPFVLSGQRARR